MKGLIRNNFYTAESSLKSTLVLSLVSAIVLGIVSIFTADIDNLLTMIISGNIGGFGALATTIIQKDAASKWNKFELTMPISRKDVITARYISCILYILIGIVMALVNVLLVYVITDTLNLERINYGFIFGYGFALSIPTFMNPLVLILGTDKTEPIMLITIIADLGLFVGFTAILSPIVRNIDFSNFIFRFSYMLFSTILFLTSYLLSCWIYKKKEL